MRYYIWFNRDERPVSKAWPYEDEIERMAEEQRPPGDAVTLRAGTREQLKALYHLSETDFIDS